MQVPLSHFSQAIIDEAIDEWRKRLVGEGYTPDSDSFRSHLLPSKWPVLDEFHSASSEGSGRKNKRAEDRRRIVVKLSPTTSMSGGLITGMRLSSSNQSNQIIFIGIWQP